MNCQTSIEDFTKSTMVGLSVIGNSSAQTVAFILAGRYDFEIKCAFYYAHMKKNAQKIEDLEVLVVVNTLERLKNLHRKDIQAIFEHTAAVNKVELMSRLKDTNKPHEMGTISEIAEKYGIPKNEVRRRKLNGTLHELDKTALEI